MRIDLDSRTSGAFLLGAFGLLFQLLADTLFGLDPEPVLTTTFGGLVLAAIGVGVARGTGSKRNEDRD